MKKERRKLTIESLECRRMLASGNLDTTFGVAGRSTTEFRESNTWGRNAYASVVQPDGKIVAAGEGALVRYQPDGKIDTSFGVEGRVAVPLFARAVALGTNNTILVAGGDTEFNSSAFVVARFDSSGNLDPTFDSDGIANITFGVTNEFVSGITVQANGRIVLVGTSGSRLAVARTLENGALDVSFDGDGRFIRQIGSLASASQVTIQPNGRILIVGNSLATSSTGTSVLVMRLHTTGALDASFQGTGFTLTPIGGSFSSSWTKGIALQADGKIVVSGYSRFSFDDYLSVIRFNADGSLDPTWDNDGIRLHSIFVQGTSTFVGNGVAVQSSGEIVTQALGQVYRFLSDGQFDTTFDSDGIAAISGMGRSLIRQPNGSFLVAGTFNQLFGVARLNLNGSMDTTFSGDGVAMTDMGSSVDQAAASILQPDGKIVVLGSSGQQFGIARYTSNGVLDSSFSQDGLASIFFGDEFWTSEARDVALQPDGKILVVGTLRRFQNPVSTFAMAVARLNSDGSLDTSFSDDGLLVLSTAQSFRGNAIALQSNGRIVIGGRVGNAFAVTRLLANGTLDLSFSLDGWTSLPSSSADSEVLDLVVQNDGKILAVGTHSPYSFGRYPSSLMMARFNPNGTLDTTFGTSGRRIETGLGQRTGEQLELLADGSFLVAGNVLTTSSFSTSSTMAVTKFDAQGRLVGGFGVFGTLFIRWDFPFFGDFGASATNSTAKGLLVQSDGKIVISGELNGQFAVARAFPDGVLDSSFAGDGKATFPLVQGTGPRGGTAIDVLQQANGRLIVVGSNRSTNFARPDSDFELLRLLDVPVPAVTTVVRLNGVGYIELSDQWSRNDRWEIGRLNADELFIREVSNDPKVNISVMGLPGVTLINNREITIPISLISLTGLPLLIQGRGGDDSLTRIGDDFIAPPTGLNFLGGDGIDQLSQATTTIASTWEMQANGNGVLKSDGQGWTRFSSIEHFVGGPGSDTFMVSTQGTNTSQLRFEGGDFSGLDQLQVVGDVDMIMPDDFLPSGQYRLNLVKNTSQRLSLRGIESLELTGGIGNNVINVQRFQGTSSLFGGRGNDTLFSSAGSSLLDGQDGDDQLFGNTGNDTLRGGNGNDLLVGDSGDDILEGNAGRDILVGGFGTDILRGGTGDDLLIGGYALDLLRNADAANRNSILSRWASTESYANRTTDLLEGLNGPALIPNSNVFTDGAVDSFFGEGGVDWFFASRAAAEPEINLTTGRVGDSLANELVTPFS